MDGSGLSSESSRNEESVRELADTYGQAHLLRFWDELDTEPRSQLIDQFASIDFPLINRLTEEWICSEKKEERLRDLSPVPVLPCASESGAALREILDAGEEALSAGRVGLVLVAGGQGTRLGFDGPKGAFPIGTQTARSLFAYHADKIRNLQQRYGCVLPWYIMVGESNGESTRSFFQTHEYFGLEPGDVTFFHQRMMPCVGDDGKLFLEEKHRIAMNPNGHGGCLAAMVEEGITSDAAKRGIDTLSYFQVDNWAVRVADPYFIGQHVSRNAQMSSRAFRKRNPRESVGVNCLAAGVHHIVEYTELDLYPQLLEADADGKLLYPAGNCAIHVLAVDFIEQIAAKFAQFPWHCSHKRIPHIDAQGKAIDPPEPNGYKFETFVFDALQYAGHEPVLVEIEAVGDYTPIKQPTGQNSVEAARVHMSRYWGGWLRDAGIDVDEDAIVEISPRFALTQEEFLTKTISGTWPASGPIVIGPQGESAL